MEFKDTSGQMVSLREGEVWDPVPLGAVTGAGLNSSVQES